MAASETNTNIITIGGPVSVLWTSYDGSQDREITDINIIKSFDGSIYMDSDRGGALPLELSVYLSDGDDTSHLYKLGVRSGILKYTFKKDKNQLWLETEYSAPRELNDKEIQDLYNFTKSQWIDGAGSNFTGELSDKNKGTNPLSEPNEIYVYQSNP